MRFRFNVAFFYSLLLLLPVIINSQYPDENPDLINNVEQKSPENLVDDLVQDQPENSDNLNKPAPEPEKSFDEPKKTKTPSPKSSNGFEFFDVIKGFQKKVQNQFSSAFTDILLPNVGGFLSKCRNDIFYVIKSKKEPWAMQMLDSFGKPTSALLKGSVVWHGYFDECKAVRAPTGDNNQGGFEGKYCTTSWEVSADGKNVPLKLGVCVPGTCPSKEVKESLNLLKIFLETKFDLKKDYGIEHVELQSVECHEKMPPPSRATIGTIVGFIFLIILVIMGTGLDYFCNYYQLDVKGSPSNDPKLQETLKDLMAQSENSVIAEKHLLVQQSIPDQSRGRMVNFLFCFSLPRNFDRIKNPPPSNSVKDQRFKCIYGLRFFCTVWLLAGTTVRYAPPFYFNPLDTLRAATNWSSSPLIQYIFAVDSLLLIFGFLLSYNFLKNHKDPLQIRGWILYFGSKYLRMTIPLVAVVLIYANILPFSWDSPYWTTLLEKNLKCAKTMSWHTLYLNNLIPESYNCGPWTWFLSNEWQFFCLTPFILTGLIRIPETTVLLCCVFMCGSSLVTGTINYSYHLQTLITDNINLKEEPQRINDRLELYEDVIMVKPYCRIVAYLMGLCLGFICQDFVKQKQAINDRVRFVGWVASGSLVFFFLFSVYDTNLTVFEASLWKGMSSFCWSLALAWFIFASITEQQGGVLNSFLSIEAWQPLSRLSFSAYLIYELVFAGYFYALKAPIYFANSTVILFLVAITIVSYFFALVFALVVEQPVLQMGKILHNNLLVNED